MFTYLSAANANDPSSVTLRLAGSHPHDDYRLRLRTPIGGMICVPHGISEEAAEALTKVLDEETTPLEDTRDFVENLKHHVNLCVAMIRAISPLSETVSPSCQIAAHVLHRDLGYRIGISPICEDGRFSLDLRSGSCGPAGLQDCWHLGVCVRLKRRVSLPARIPVSASCRRSK